MKDTKQMIDGKPFPSGRGRLSIFGMAALDTASAVNKTYLRRAVAVLTRRRRGVVFFVPKLELGNQMRECPG